MKKLNNRAQRRLDERLASAKPIDRLTPPPKGWIRAIRDGLGMSGAQLGRRLGISRQAVEQIEKSEITGAIQLSTLRRIAETLDSTLVYVLVPNRSLNEMVRERARSLALRALARVSHTMRLEDQQTTDLDLESRIEDYVRDELSDRDLWNEP